MFRVLNLVLLHHHDAFPILDRIETKIIHHIFMLCPEIFSYTFVFQYPTFRNTTRVLLGFGASPAQAMGTPAECLPTTHWWTLIYCLCDTGDTTPSSCEWYYSWNLNTYWRSWWWHPCLGNVLWSRWYNHHHPVGCSCYHSCCMGRYLVDHWYPFYCPNWQLVIVYSKHCARDCQ